MDTSGENTLAGHIEALRWTILRILLAIALLYPIGYWLAPHAIRCLVAWAFPEGGGQLHYFSPMEVFWVQLKLGLYLSLLLSFPWNLWQVWKFILPALHPGEKRSLGLWLFASTFLFAGGCAFCLAIILPMLMRFAGSFSQDALQPLYGLANFLELAGWLSLSFGLMFQAPVAVLLAVRFGAISAARLASFRPYVLVGILILAAILTPPDVVSQLLLALPTWLLFEIGLFLARRLDPPQKNRRMRTT